MAILSLFFLIFVSYLGIANGEEALDLNFIKCPLTDDDKLTANECLKNSMGDAIIRLSNDPELQKSLNLPDLDPLHFKKLDIKHGNPDDPVSFSLKLRNCKNHGLANSEMKKARISYNDENKAFHIRFELNMPILSTIGPYEIQGKILLLPIQGNGNTNLTFANAKFTGEMRGVKYIENGISSIKLNKFELKLSCKRMYSHFTNLFNGNEELGNVMNNFMNENWQTIYADVIPSINKGFSDIFGNYAKTVLRNIPFEEIFS